MQQSHEALPGRILKLQSAIGLAGAVLALPIGWSVALAIFIGALTAVAANVVLAMWVFRPYRAQEPRRIVVRFYGGEVAKLVLIMSSFGLALALVDDLDIPALLGAYAAVQIVPTLIAALTGNRTKQ